LRRTFNCYSYLLNLTDISSRSHPHPIVCLDERLRKYLQSFHALFSQPQFEHFVTVLVALLMSLEGQTLSHLHRAVAGKKSLSSISRFLSQAPWSHQDVIKYNFSRFCHMMNPKIEQERQKVKDQQKKLKRRGRRKEPLVTGYLIGDDSTMSKTKGVKMQGLGRHHSTTYGKRIIGHSLVQCLYTVLGRFCPLEPFLYRQKKTAEKEGVQFLSKIDIMIQYIQNFTPPDGTLTHMLLDSWYSAKKIWKAARDRGFLITTGLKCNRSLRIFCDITPETPKGWKWQSLSEYAASLPKNAYQLYSWPRNPQRKVWVHIVDTHVKTLYRCKLIIIRHNLDDPIKDARYFATSDLDANAQRCLEHISARWDIEVLFEDGKGLLGIDRYQLMTTTALLRYWTLCWIAFSYLEEIRDELKHQKVSENDWPINNKINEKLEEKDKIDHMIYEDSKDLHATLGQAKRFVQETHHKLFLAWIYKKAFSGTPVEDLHAFLLA